MDRKELVAMFMESPFYFDMIIQERYELIQEHLNRYSTNSLYQSIYSCKIIKHQNNNESNVVTKIIVGYFPPKYQPIAV